VVISVEIDVDRCCGAGACVLRAPEVFDQNEADGTVVLLDEHPADAQADAVDRAAEMCPANAITVRRDRTASGERDEVST
jgi:ferredoxin